MASRGYIPGRDVGYAKGESYTYREGVATGGICKTDDDVSAHMLKKILEFEPDILLWWQCKNDRPAGLVEAVRERLPDCKTVFQTPDDPYQFNKFPEWSDGFEFAATCTANIHDEYAKRGIKSITLYPPVDIDLHGGAVPDAKYVCDVAFAPRTIYKKGDWTTQICGREEIIEALKGMDLDLRLYGGWPGSTDRFMEYHELPRVYASAKISINHHINVRAKGYLNIRALSIPASGGFSISDKQIGVSTGEVLWASLPEMVQKIRWWLAHDHERRLAAKWSQACVLENYDNVAFANDLIDFVGLSHE